MPANAAVFRGPNSTRLPFDPTLVPLVQLHQFEVKLVINIVKDSILPQRRNNRLFFISKMNWFM